MARPKGPQGSCTVCKHPEVGRINFVIARGAPILAVARQFQLSKSAAHRHYRNHVPETFKAAARLGPFQSEEHLRSLCAEAGTSVVENLRGVYSGLAARWLNAFLMGADEQLCRITPHLHANLATQAKITGELMPTPSNVTIAVFTPEGFASLARDLMGLVRQHPQIREDLAAILRARLAPPVTEPTSGQTDVAA